MLPPESLAFIDAWDSPAITANAFTEIMNHAEKLKTIEKNILYPQTVWNPANDQRGLSVLQARSVVPHVDADFAQWSVLVVLQHGDGHAMHVADHVPKGQDGIGRVHKSKPQWSVPVHVGQIILFNAHSAHWLPAIKDKTLFIAANFDFAQRPTREQVETHILAEIKRFSTVRKAA